MRDPWDQASAELTREAVGAYDTQLASSPLTGRPHYRQRRPTRASGTPAKRRRSWRHDIVTGNAQIPAVSGDLQDWEQLMEHGNWDALLMLAQQQRPDPAGEQTAARLRVLATCSAWSRNAVVEAEHIARAYWDAGVEPDFEAYSRMRARARITVHLEDVPANVVLTAISDIMTAATRDVDLLAAWAPTNAAGVIARAWLLECEGALALIDATAELPEGGTLEPVLRLVMARAAWQQHDKVSVLEHTEAGMAARGDSSVHAELVSLRALALD